VAVIRHGCLPEAGVLQVGPRLWLLQLKEKQQMAYETCGHTPSEER
jgi:hypothetical protein